MRHALLSAAMAGLAAAQSIEFVDTTIQNPTSVGQTSELMWSTGNGQAISLALANATWLSSVFSERAVAPARYSWTLSMLPGLVSGDYFLVITQDGGETAFKSVTINVPAGVTAPMPWSNATATTVTVWDDDCTCHKTSTMTPTVTATISCPHTTSTWSDMECGCQKTALVPLPTMTSNYTAPGQPPSPPAITTPAPMGTGAPPMSSPSPMSPMPYANGAFKAAISILGLLAGIMAFVLL